MKIGDLITQAKHIRDVLLRPTFRDRMILADSGFRSGPFWDVSGHVALPGADDRPASGVYIVSGEDHEVLYIGKDTTGNMDREVWKKLGTPAEASTPGRRIFPKTAWSESAAFDEKTKQTICLGGFYVDAIVVEPPECASLYETYLRTYCYLQDGRLPALNARIG
jgi:hypothetical protein